MKGSRVPLATAALVASLMMGTALAAPAIDSRVSGLAVTGPQPVGTFNGVAYVRTYGVVKGMIGQGEDVVGFADLPKNAQGRYEYASELEIIAPAPAPAPGQPANEVILVDAENRGGAARRRRSSSAAALDSHHTSPCTEVELRQRVA